MEPTEYRTRDKSAWGGGPWDDEPDKVQWIDKETDLDCLIVRNRGGALCGYVGVPPSHPWFEKGYDDVDVSVHGGLTFSDTCNESTRAAWERARADLPRWRAEAAKYPKGDAAQLIKRFEPFADDYDGWAMYHQSVAICHIPAPGRPEVWWFGFDCAHCMDISPAHAAFGYSDGEFYRDIEYVKSEVASLARQLSDATTAKED